jgi:phosphoenolpyruvate synthase/pyruvate phosphate dikinase
LSDDDVIELARVGKQIEGYYGAPRDIEWAIDQKAAAAGGIRILQCRAETVWSQTRSEQPIVEKRGSAVEYVLAQLMELSGARSRGKPGEGRP